MRSMGDGVEPKTVRHLFYSQIHPCHVHHSFPAGLHTPIGQLLLSRSGKNLGAVIDEIFRDGSPEEFGITVTIEATRKRAS